MQIKAQLSSHCKPVLTKIATVLECKASIYALVPIDYMAYTIRGIDPGKMAGRRRSGKAIGGFSFFIQFLENIVCEYWRLELVVKALMDSLHSMHPHVC